MVVMARLLVPADFGVYSILMIFVSFMQILGIMGTAQVIVHLDDPSQRMLSTIFFFNLLLGLFLFFVLYLLAWPLSAFFDNPKLTQLLQIMGVNFIVSSFGLVQKALYEKSLLFKRVVVIETLALAIAVSVGISAAVMGLGVYSLLMQNLLSAGCISVGLWLSSSWRPSLMFSFDDVKKIWGYTINLTSFNIVNYFSRNADNFLIGKFIGSSALGVYSVAYQIMLYPLDCVSRVLIRVLFPAFSHVKYDNDRFKRGYLKTISFISLITFPLMAGLMVLSGPFVDVTFGNKWKGLSSLLIILAPIGMIQSVVTTTGTIYIAKGTTSLMFKIGMVNSVVTVLSFVVGLPYGVKGVAICYGVANLIMLYPNLKASWHQIDLRLIEGIHKIFPFFSSSILMATVLYVQGFALRNLLNNSFIFLLIQIVLGIFLYAIFIVLLNKSFMLSILKELKIYSFNNK